MVGYHAWNHDGSVVTFGHWEAGNDDSTKQNLEDELQRPPRHNSRCIHIHTLSSDDGFEACIEVAMRLP